MIRDERGLPLSTNSAEAASLFDRSVEHWLKFHNDTMALAGRMLAADPQFRVGALLQRLSAAQRVQPGVPL